MKIIDRQNIDIPKWNALVSENSGTPFSFSWYLDAVAENWKIIVNDDYSSGMALPYTIRMGVEILYTPIFSRYSEWLGHYKFQEAESIVRDEFKVIELATKAPFFKFESTQFVYQTIDKNDKFILSSQALRTIKKALNVGLIVIQGVEYANVKVQIENELKGKHRGLTNSSMPRLYGLFEAAKNEGKLTVFEVMQNEVKGGIVCVETETTLLYLKGAVDEETKKNGGMYLALKTAMDYAKSEKKNFDFGGSRIEGVRKFNHNLGGQDTVYHAYEINKAPFWFNAARFVKKWKK